MKIAQPLGWERLCSDSAADAAFVMAKQNAIQNCETRFQEVSKPSFAKEKKKSNPFQSIEWFATIR